MMVMPFSRSRSIESMMRSGTDSLARKRPDCQSMASTRVVLPWSTWAMIATFRMLARCCINPSYHAPPAPPPHPESESSRYLGRGGDPPRGSPSIRTPTSGRGGVPSSRTRPAYNIGHVHTPPEVFRMIRDLVVLLGTVILAVLPAAAQEPKPKAAPPDVKGAAKAPQAVITLEKGGEIV